MFPVQFAFDMVQAHCPEKGAVLDPFAGRGSSIYASITTGRYGYGIEINKVGWLYSHVKLSPASQADVSQRVCEIDQLAKKADDSIMDGLPEFFTWCFSKQVLKYLITAKNKLDWQYNRVDSTLMAIILVDLHGNSHLSLSNQIRQVKAIAQEYSNNRWKENETQPPDIDPTENKIPKTD